MGKIVVSETTLILWVHGHQSQHGHHVHGNFDLAIVYILIENFKKDQIQWLAMAKIPLL